MTLVEFAAIRAACPALSRIVIPDDIWDNYKLFCESEPDEAFHAPITYLAFQRRYLAALTGPIHTYCLDGGKPNSALTKQYKKDLVERWMFGETTDQRFEYHRMFQGRLFELIFAQWLDHEGWSIHGLEARGADVDVEAMTRRGDSYSFEVKHIGKDKCLFDLELEALQTNRKSAGSISVYSPVDYMLYRIYEAACQLKKATNQKVVVVILSDFDIYYEHKIKKGWIDWKAPRFFKIGADIIAFLEDKYKKNPTLDDDLERYISQIDEIWFFSKENLIIRYQHKQLMR